ncbi:Uncharacterised protein [Achromobacter kerstersii]|nr:Uncharacterised protein [Achromobacter kerstersii]
MTARASEGTAFSPTNLDASRVRATMVPELSSTAATQPSGKARRPSAAPIRSGEMPTFRL